MVIGLGQLLEEFLTETKKLCSWSIHSRQVQQESDRTGLR
ncbi:hypothetical protein SynROS8604_01092 [Synechococcus sp. ROS8604]|nr:hypothetical protein SynROS8604_01092 [Synechococcus sp. ROS8604]